jgi:hypothetical protein
MKTKGYDRRPGANRSLRQHIVAIASSPLGREIAVAALVAVATAITHADKRQGLLKTIGRNLREAATASLAPVIAEILRPAKQQPVRRRRRPAQRARA